MKKTRFVLSFILIFVLISGICFAVYAINSPEYALLQIKKDVEESGVDGLMPHLTQDAQKTVSTIVSIAENDKVNSIISFFNKDNQLGSIASNAKDVEWSVEDILKSKNKAEVIVKFNYKEKLKGTIEVNMIKEDHKWLISGLDLPKLSK